MDDDFAIPRRHDRLFHGCCYTFPVFCRIVPNRRKKLQSWNRKLMWAHRRNYCPLHPWFGTFFLHVSNLYQSYYTCLGVSYGLGVKFTLINLNIFNKWTYTQLGNIDLFIRKSPHWIGIHQLLSIRLALVVCMYDFNMKRVR